MRYRLILLAACLALACSAARGADHSESERMIERYSSEPGAEVTVIRGGDLTRYGLSEYRSLTLPDVTATTLDAIAGAVKADLEASTAREVSYRDGRIKYAFLTLAPTAEGLNRYVIFVCNPAHNGRRRVVLIAIEGKATARQLQNLIKITSK